MEKKIEIISLLLNIMATGGAWVHHEDVDVVCQLGSTIGITICGGSFHNEEPAQYLYMA